MTDLLTRPGEPELDPRELPATDASLEGDASLHLEELVLEPLPDLLLIPSEQTEVEIELVGPHLRVAGTMSTGYHRRLSDFINHHTGLLHLRAVTVLRRNGEPTKVRLPDMWASPHEVTLVAQTGDAAAAAGGGDLVVPRAQHPLVIVTSGHTLTGTVHIAQEAGLAGFVESSDPPFVPMTDVRARSLADRRVISRYPFALVNRRHIVAASEMQPGMISGRSVL
jgi:hypothetical protein